MNAEERQKIFSLLCWLIGGLVVVYVYLINSLIFGAVEQRKISDGLNQTQAQVASLENRYLAEGGKITWELAKELGFHDASGETVFAFYTDLPLAIRHSINPLKL